MYLSVGGGAGPLAGGGPLGVGTLVFGCTGRSSLASLSFLHSHTLFICLFLVEFCFFI